MKTPNRFSIDLSIPTYWTAEQALAVFDLVDSLREKIWGHYQGKILEIVPEDRGRPHVPPHIRWLRECTQMPLILAVAHRSVS